ncbi:MAG TPA: hypothetical protein VHV10_12315, partial [Ktedonobacteraceae bacterium]|nr:hypothetical protein [Ktedonobacteraceae bacterium]
MADQTLHPQDHSNLETCDIVMTGGVTSGIVYPPAVITLKDRYSFRKIGGTSAGAIAAAGLAAAEFNRRNSGTNAGFCALKDTCTWL